MPTAYGVFVEPHRPFSVGVARSSTYRTPVTEITCPRLTKKEKKAWRKAKRRQQLVVTETVYTIHRD